MTTTLKELDEVLALQASMVMLRQEKEECAAGSYQRQFQYCAAKYVRDHAPEIRAALELKARVDAGDVIVPRENIERGIEMARVFDDGSDGADAGSAARVVSILSAMLEAPPAQENEDDDSDREPCSGCLNRSCNGECMEGL